ncbi:hypothetical protein JXL21_10130 [Candidatus Bathyarchaeota archaeon]|nr:hypothetical protein [Candidatus Bathyarchaeota archaeon]
MVKCNICGVDSPIIYECEECGTNFCFFCGSIAQKRCVKCITEREGDVFDKRDWLVRVARSRC